MQTSGRVFVVVVVSNKPVPSSTGILALETLTAIQ